MKTLAMLGVVGVLAMGAAGAHAAMIPGTVVTGASVPLSTLVGTGSTVQVGDELFGNFSYRGVGDMPAADRILVTQLLDDGYGNVGIRFQGAFIDLYDITASDALIGFSVTATNPDRLITDAHLAGNPAMVGGGFVCVTETLIPQNDTELQVYDVQPKGLRQTQDAVTFASGLRTLNVQKDIVAMAVTEGSVATLSFLDQSFSESSIPDGGTPPTPEPASLGLLALGATGLLMRRRA